MAGRRGEKIESEFRPDNDVFAQHIWGKPWAEVFADDILHEFTPNDFDKCPMDESIERQFGHAIREMTPIVEQVLLDPALAVEAPWNDLLAVVGELRGRRFKNLAGRCENP